MSALADKLEKQVNRVRLGLEECVDLSDVEEAVETLRHPSAVSTGEREELLKALGSFLNILRGSSDVLPGGYTLHVRKDAYEKARDVYDAILSRQPSPAVSTGSPAPQQPSVATDQNAGANAANGLPTPTLKTTKG